jgi:signal transduction histidine kinase
VLEAVRRLAGAVSLSFQPAHFELRLAVEGALARLTSQLGAAGAEVDQHDLPVVYGDRAQITILFEELIGNALRYRSGEPLRIEIAATPVEQDAHWLISIADNGIGLPDQNPGRVFRPLAKRDANARPGIGLTICRYIARLHGGEVTAVPLPQGAEFRLRLPQSQAAVAGRPGAALGL